MNQHADAPPRVVVVGLGYIGLPTAALMAKRGLPVRGVDVNPRVVETVNAGRIHIVEPDLEGLVLKAVRDGLLSARAEPAAADVFVIAVPTPFRGNHEPDLAFVEAAVRSIAPHLAAGNLVLLESTSPVGTTESVAATLTALRPDLAGTLAFAYCPERVLPGRIIYELEHNDRVVGGVDAASTARAAAFYRRFVRGEIFPADARTAEMVKLTENAFRDVNIAFANELSMICARHAIDVHELIRLANRHPRVKILEPGCGVGGHCIAVDPWFIVDLEPELARLVRTAREVNDAKPPWVAGRILADAARFEAERGRRPTVALLGLAFKADVDDLRESPALRIAGLVAGAGLTLLAVEPHIGELPATLAKHPDARLVPLAEGLAADLVYRLVAHRAFRDAAGPGGPPVRF